jgi:hypothetical protein
MTNQPTYTYKQVKPSIPTDTESCVLRIEDNNYIPFYPGNTDYEQYLAWVEDGNTAEPAD